MKDILKLPNETPEQRQRRKEFVAYFRECAERDKITQFLRYARHTKTEEILKQFLTRQQVSAMARGLKHVDLSGVKTIRETPTQAQP